MKNFTFKILLFCLLFSPVNSFSNYVLLDSYSFSNLLLQLATNKGEKEKGLMNIDRLIDFNGMFFLYKKPKVINMWMHNTRMPLDIIFIDKFSKVISINYGKPVGNGILTCLNQNQALVRSKSKGQEAANAVISVLSL